jgi:Icc-related predicted phosphoesterase
LHATWVFEKVDTLKIVAISDTHGQHRRVRLPKGDVLVHAGDLTTKGEFSEVSDFLDWFSKLPFARKIFIAGNHDFFFEKAPDALIQKQIPEGVVYLNDSGITINDLNIWGSPVTPWFFDWAFNRQRGADINRHWKRIPSNTDLLVTHGPAFGILDVIINGNHTGDKDLLKMINEIKPKVHLCGHIHESYGSLKRGTTRHVNASLVNERYELVNPPVVFDL